MTRRTTPGTRRTWATGLESIAHLRDLLRRTGTRAKVYRDLEAHLQACDRAFIREQTRDELERLQDFIRTERHHRVRPPRHLRAGSPYVLITEEVHNCLQNLRARDRRREKWVHSQILIACRQQQLRLPFDVVVAPCGLAEAA